MYLEIVIVGFIAVLICFYYIFFKIIPVADGYKYITMEMERAVSEKERKRWKKKRKKLLLSLIPFVSLFK
ncbi:MAG: hypothetical protein SOZ34_07320 [Clostridia bacterium]|nr:hypothetical protein [Clostridia bacterium]